MADHPEIAAAPETGTPPESQRLGQWIERGLDILYPPQCLICDTAVTNTGTICAACWSAIQFIDQPFCAVCGLPFDYDLGPDAVCGACARKRPAYDRARAAMVYDDHSRRLIIAFKHGDRTDYAPALGRWLGRAGSQLIAGADIVVPVPLHWTRLYSRRFNQAAMLADLIAREANLPFAPNILSRRRRTPPQGRLSASARWRNLRGAFAVPARHRGAVKGRRVLLVDDVLTTGATVSVSAAALRRAGAASIDVLTLARVVRDRS